MLRVIKRHELAGLTKRINNAIREIGTQCKAKSGHFIIYGEFSEKVLPEVICEHEDYLDAIDYYGDGVEHISVFKFYDMRYKDKVIYYISGVKTVAFELTKG